MTFAAASCGDPGSPENGYRTGGVFTFGNKLTFHCQRGYEMKGASREIECQSNGRWSGTLPTCEGIFETFQFWHHLTASYAKNDIPRTLFPKS